MTQFSPESYDEGDGHKTAFETVEPETGIDLVTVVLLGLWVLAVAAYLILAYRMGRPEAPPPPSELKAAPLVGKPTAKGVDPRGWYSIKGYLYYVPKVDGVVCGLIRKENTADRDHYTGGYIAPESKYEVDRAFASPGAAAAWLYHPERCGPLPLGVPEGIRGVMK